MRKTTQFKFKIKIFIIIFILFLFFLNRGHFIAFSQFILNKIIIFSGINDRIIEENKKLKDEILLYKESEEIIYFLNNENLELKKRFEYLDSLNKKRKLFNVYKRDFFNQRLWIYDPDNFLKNNQLIFFKYNILIGYVLNKDSSMAEIRLFDESGYKNLYKIFDGGELILELEGEGMGSGLIRVTAPRNLEFKNEKVFLTFGQNESYLVAKLVEIEFIKQNPNKILYFKTLINPSLISKVESVEDEFLFKK